MTVKHKLALVLAFSILDWNSVISQETAPLITISDGKIKGAANRTVRENISYYSYRGIPFAKPPIGNLRFAAPVQNDPWKDTLDATKDKDQCVQISSTLASSDPIVAGSEDCLHINVYTTNVNGNLPVMVWIYGGGFIGGTSAYDIYAPDYFLEKGVVYVSFNYRLGIFGFLSTEDMEAPGNWGLKDQILALKWVKRNIKKFGGDPSKVTIFGESAGGASISYLVNSKLTQGLFEGAIMESGTSLSSWALTRNARLKAFKVGLRLPFLTLSSKRLVEHLRTVDYKTLKLAEQNITLTEITLGNILAGLPFGVVKEPDHPEAVFSSKSWELVKNGEFQKVPLIVGFNSDETASFDQLINFLRPLLVKYDIDRYLLPPYDLTPNVFKRTGAAIEISNYFFGTNSISNNITAFKRFSNLEFFLRPSRELVKLASKYTKTYLYEFSYKGLYGDPNKNFTGVGHAEELNYLFVSKNNGTAKDAEIVQKFVTLWTNFAKTGNPTPQSTTSSGTVLGQLNWIPNNLIGNSGNNTVDIKFLQINDTLSMEINPFQKDWEFYQKIYSNYGDPPYGTY